MKYLLAYSALGLFSLIIALLRGIPDKDHRISGSLFLLVFWPFFVLFAGMEIVTSRSSKEYKDTKYSKLKIDLCNALEESFLDGDEKTSIERIIGELDGDVASFGDIGQVESAISEFWKIELHPKLYFDYVRGKYELEKPREDSGIQFSIREPDWYIGLTNEFLKSINKIDKKLQSKIFDALKSISESPTEPNGNTVKPLGHQLKGIWRYRVGDYRLLYKPDASSKQILLLRFSHRKKAYDENLNIIT